MCLDIQNPLHGICSIGHAVEKLAHKAYENIKRKFQDLTKNQPLNVPFIIQQICRSFSSLFAKEESIPLAVEPKMLCIAYRYFQKNEENLPKFQKIESLVKKALGDTFTVEHVVINPYEVASQKITGDRVLLVSSSFIQRLDTIGNFEEFFVRKGTKGVLFFDEEQIEEIDHQVFKKEFEKLGCGFIIETYSNRPQDEIVQEIRKQWLP